MTLLVPNSARVFAKQVPRRAGAERRMHVRDVLDSSGDREARLARALRENLKRRKARDRATVTPIQEADVGGAVRSTDIEATVANGCLGRPAAERD